MKRGEAEKPPAAAEGKKGAPQQAGLQQAGAGDGDDDVFINIQEWVPPPWLVTEPGHVRHERTYGEVRSFLEPPTEYELSRRFPGRTDEVALRPQRDADAASAAVSGSPGPASPR